MTIILAFILGAFLSKSGLLAKQINSIAGWQIANQKVHNYVTLVGGLSNLIIPIVITLIALLIEGIGASIGVLTATIVGAFLSGLVRIPHGIDIIVCVFGLPIALLAFLISLS